MNQSRCKNCGGQVEISNTSRFVQCEYCGSTFELDPNRAQFANFYIAADDAWGRKDFEEALRYYLQITEMDHLQSEAHWGAALCRYGIAYEIDPVSGEKKPTCNRTNTESIFEDKNYISAIKHASPENKQKYLLRATEIDRISIEFLKIVKNEPAYDVFISYKRTDDKNIKTIDAEYAMKLYLYLKNNGIKVFFAEETLKHVAGSLYEPHIFAALHSAKVMVLIGSSKENIESTWVKNEWQRFFKLMETTPEKVLIPAFIGDPYNILPQRLQPLQSFNAGSPAFVEEILENIKKKLTSSTQNATPIDGGAQMVTLKSLLERAYMLVSDGEFEKASMQLEKVLDIDPKCDEAYLCNLMIEFRVTKESQLAELSQRIDLSSNYKKIMTFGNDELKKRVLSYSEQVMKRIGEAELKRQEVQQKKSALIKMIASADNTLNEINSKREKLKSQIDAEESSLSALKNKIAQSEIQKKGLQKYPSFVTLLGLIAIVLNVILLVWSSENIQTPTALFFFLAFALPATIVFTISLFSYLNIGGLFVAIVIWFFTFVVVCIVNGGGILESILGVFYDCTLGLIFGDKMVLTELNLQRSCFFAAQVIYVIAFINSIVQIVELIKDKNRYKMLQNQIEAATQKYNDKLQQNTVLLQLHKNLEQENANYNDMLANFKIQLSKENREYLVLAQKAGQKPEPVLPQKYL